MKPSGFITLKNCQKIIKDYTEIQPSGTVIRKIDIKQPNGVFQLQIIGDSKEDVKLSTED